MISTDMISLVSTPTELAAARAGLPGRVAVVMTMGALHEGHASLLRLARSRADSVIATAFVNPLQFGPGEDFERYPRTPAADRAIFGAAGVDLVFAPPADALYPSGQPAVRVDPGPLGMVLEGASRPGHFSGVLTVVLKLLNLTRPDLAVFGEKDYQQLALIRRMVDDFDLPVEVVGGPTVREADGLAMSSRNRYLSEAERRSAVTLSQALFTGARVAARPARAGGSQADAVLRAAREVIEADPGVQLDYLALTQPDLGPIDLDAGPVDLDAGRVDLDAGPDVRPVHARLLVAASVGSTRLIDNVAVEFS